MKVVTILGTRPEIIRLSQIIPKLDAFAGQHLLIHTGQNFDDRLSGLFFSELEMREPDIQLGIRSETFSEQVGQILQQSEKILRDVRPDRVLILGDTNSGLAVLTARRLGIPVYHMEAGNRCYDDRVPEEINRRVIDHSSSVLMPYTGRSRDNLLREGIPDQNIHVIGNPIYEVLEKFAPRVEKSGVLERLNLKPEKFFLVTLHRSENVDIESRLNDFLQALITLHSEYGLPVIVSCHPRMRSRMQAFHKKEYPEGILFLEPFGLLDFLKLQKSAFCVMSDSGTVQEESCILRVPNVTLRDVTERPETMDGGSCILSGSSSNGILKAVKIATTLARDWQVPPEYVYPDVSTTVTKIVLGYKSGAGGLS